MRRKNHRFMEFVLIWSLVTVMARVATAEEKEKCYGEFGCFDLKPPWVGVMRPLPAPQSPEKVKLQFHLVTKNTITKDKAEWKLAVTDLYKPTLENLQELDYQNSREDTVILIHGMYVSVEWNWSVLKKMAEAYLSKKDVNIFIMKWASGATHLYHQLVANIRVVGAVAAKFIEQLMKLTKLTADKIHMVGFSLGGHVAGYIGKRISNIKRITGLDIAGPLFRNADRRYRLYHEDADQVDVLHTDTLNFIGLGYGPPAGHVDFYFNGGVRQSGCIVNFGGVVKNVFKFKLGEALKKGYLLGACSHIKAIQYWIESIANSNCTMWGFARPDMDNKVHYRSLIQYTAVRLLMTHRNWVDQDCSNFYKCAPVGLDTFDYVSSGTFYVHTKLSSPYCAHSLLRLTSSMTKRFEEQVSDEIVSSLS